VTLVTEDIDKHSDVDNADACCMIFLRPIRYSAWSIHGFCQCLFNIYGRLVRCNVSTDPH